MEEKMGGSQLKMGRIKTKLIKRVAITLLDKYKEKFTNDYGQNKKIVEDLTETRSKKLKNSISGYITRLVKKEKTQPGLPT